MGESKELVPYPLDRTDYTLDEICLLVGPEGVVIFERPTGRKKLTMRALCSAPKGPPSAAN